MARLCYLSRINFHILAIIVFTSQQKVKIVEFWCETKSFYPLIVSTVSNSWSWTAIGLKTMKYIGLCNIFRAYEQCKTPVGATVVVLQVPGRIHHWRGPQFDSTQPQDFTPPFSWAWFSWASFAHYDKRSEVISVHYICETYISSKGTKSYCWYIAHENGAVKSLFIKHFNFSSSRTLFSHNNFFCSSI